MNAILPLRLAPHARPDFEPPLPVFGRQADANLQARIAGLRQRLLSQQQDDGSWRQRDAVGLYATACRLLLLAYDPPAERAEIDRLIAAIRRRRLRSGGWPAEEGREASLSVSVLCYFAIKAHEGVDALAELGPSRRFIKQQGGVQAVGEAVWAWLALFGQQPLDQDRLSRCQPVVAAALRSVPIRKLPGVRGVRELFVSATEELALGIVEDSDEAPLSDEASETVWRLLAEVAGAPGADPPNGDEPPPQAPVLETAVVAESLMASGMNRDREPVAAAIDWLLETFENSREDLQPLGRAQLLIALATWRHSDSKPAEELPADLSLWREDNVVAADADRRRADRVESAGDGLFADLMDSQGAEGCWASEQASLSATTATVLRSIALWAKKRNPEAIHRASQFLTSRQEADGCWNSSVTTTAQVVRALLAGGVDLEHEVVLAGANWLLAEQAESGAWQADRANARGTRPRRRLNSTPGLDAVGTGAAATALAAAGFGDSAPLDRAIDALLEASESPSEAGDESRDLLATASALAALSVWAVGAESNPAMQQEVCLKLAEVGRVE